MNNKQIIMVSEINKTIEICHKSLHNKSYELYHSRYEKLLDALLKIRNAVEEDCLYTGVSDLNIVRMIINNDPNELYESVLKTNLFFRENYSTVL